METLITRPTKAEIQKIFGIYMPISVVAHTDFFIQHPPLSPVKYSKGYVIKEPDVRFRYENADVLSLMVKSLGNISKEDASEVLQIMQEIDGAFGITIEAVMEGIQTITKDARTPFIIVDLLRERRYALPYKNWSVEQLVEFGIYKLIE